MSAPRFDGAAVWAGLSAEQRDEIGAIALELVAAWWCQEQACCPFDGSDQLLRAGDAADAQLTRDLQSAFVEAVPRVALEDADGRPLVPSRLGPVCRVCGCSQADACEEPCGWAEEDLCTACVEAGDPVNPYGSGPVPIAPRADGDRA